MQVKEIIEKAENNFRLNKLYNHMCFKIFNLITRLNDYKKLVIDLEKQIKLLKERNAILNFNIGQLGKQINQKQ